MRAVISESKVNGCQRKWYETENEISKGKNMCKSPLANVLEEFMQEEVR
jgi:hypothetical protein